MHLLIRFIINAIVLYCIAKFVPGFNHDVGIGTAIIAAVVFGLVNAIIGPVLYLLSAPVNWLTHGVFTFVINFILFALTVFFAPGFQHSGEINPWLADLYGTIVMTVVATLIQQASKSDAERRTAAVS
jgi:putative membrane protein